MFSPILKVKKWKMKKKTKQTGSQQLITPISEAKLPPSADQRCEKIWKKFSNSSCVHQLCLVSQFSLLLTLLSTTDNQKLNNRKNFIDAIFPVFCNFKYCLHSRRQEREPKFKHCKELKGEMKKNVKKGMFSVEFQFFAFIFFANRLLLTQTLSWIVISSSPLYWNSFLSAHCTHANTEWQADRSKARSFQSHGIFRLDSSIKNWLARSHAWM